MNWSRRAFLDRAAQCAAAGVGLAALTPWRALAAPLSIAEPAQDGGGQLTPVEVAYAGSMAAVMEGPMTEAALGLGIEFHGRAQGSTALAHLIAGGSLNPDVFVSITASPMRIVGHAGLAESPVAFASTAMAIAYSPRSRFAEQFQRLPWWQVLDQPGVRFGRSDPRADPQGRNIVYVCELAEEYYQRPGLRARILGPDLNPNQIFTEASLPARVQSGQLDAAASYAFQPRPFGLNAAPLPAAINLALLSPGAKALRLSLDGRTYQPEPLIFFAAALRHAAHPDAARRWTQWLTSVEAQNLLHAAGYGPAPSADRRLPNV